MPTERLTLQQGQVPSGWKPFDWQPGDLDAAGSQGYEFPSPLQGYCAVFKDYVSVPLVESANPQAFLRLLRQLEDLKPRVEFTTMLNPRLAKLLVLRGYKYEERLGYSELFQEWADGYWVEKTPEGALTGPGASG